MGLGWGGNIGDWRLWIDDEIVNGSRVGVNDDTYEEGLLLD